MNLTETIYKQHAQNTKWVNKILFYTDEIMIMANKLKELASGNDHSEFKNDALHFEQQLFQHRIGINEINSEVSKNEKALLRDIMRNPVSISKQKQEYLYKEFEIISSFERNFYALRQDFNWFCANWA